MYWSSELYMVIWKITGWVLFLPPLLIFITVKMMPQSSSKNQSEQLLWAPLKHTREENNKQEPQICHMKFWFQWQPLKAAGWLSQINLPDTASPAWLVLFTASGSQTPAVLPDPQIYEETEMPQQAFLTESPFSLLPRSITPLVLSCSVPQIYRVILDHFLNQWIPCQKYFLQDTARF